MDNSQPIENTDDENTGEVKHCARCFGNHKIKYMKFTKNKPPGYDLWAECPVTGEPILIKLLEDGKKPGDA